MVSVEEGGFSRGTLEIFRLLMTSPNKSLIQITKSLWILLPWIGLVTGSTLLVNLFIRASIAPVSNRLFWLCFSLTLFYLPALWRLFSMTASRSERISLIAAGAFLNSLPTFLMCQSNSCGTQELAWWQSLQNLLIHSELGSENSISNIPGSYSGYSILTLILQHASGLNSIHVMQILALTFPVLSSLAIFLLGERIFLSTRAGAGAAVVFLFNPFFIFSGSIFSNSSLAVALLLTTILAASYLLEGKNETDRSGWGIVFLVLSSLLIITYPAAAYLLIAVLILIILAAVLLPHFTYLTAPERLGKFTFITGISSVTWSLMLIRNTPPSVNQTIHETWQAINQLNLSGFPFAIPLSGWFFVIVLLTILFSLLGLWLIFHLGMPVLAGSFGIFATAALIFLIFPLSMTGNFDEASILWVVPFIGISLLSGVALAWLSSPKSLNEAIKLKLKRLIGTSLIGITILICGLLFILPYQSNFPESQQIKQSEAVRPESFNAAKWMLHETGPGNRIISDKNTEQVFSSFGLQDPAFGEIGSHTQLISTDQWNTETILALIKSQASYFIVDRFSLIQPDSLPIASQSIPATGQTELLPSVEKFNQLAFLERVYDSGNIQIYHLPAGSEELLTLSQRKIALEGLGNLPLPSPFDPDRAANWQLVPTFLILLLLLLFPGVLGGAFLFYRWPEMDRTTRFLIAVSLSLAVNIFAGFIAILFKFSLVTLLQYLIFLEIPTFFVILFLYRKHLPDIFHVSNPIPTTRRTFMHRFGLAVTILVATFSTLAPISNYFSTLSSSSIKPYTELTLNLSSPLAINITSRETLPVLYHVSIRSDGIRGWRSGPLLIRPGQSIKIEIDQHLSVLPITQPIYVELYLDGAKMPYRWLRLSAQEANLLLTGSEAARP
jgi:hypothetical protein